jgi:Spy/CpxP family protein refolding chaperone
MVKGTRSRASSSYVKISASSLSEKERRCSERQSHRRRYNLEDGILQESSGERTVEKTVEKMVEKPVEKTVEETVNWEESFSNSS